MAGNMNVHSLLSVVSPNSAVLTLCLVLSWTWRTASPHVVVGARNMGPFHSAVQDTPLTATPTTTSLSSSDDSDDLEEAEVIRMMRLEMIKQKILQKLGLSAPPQISTNTADLPEPIKYSVLLGRDLGEDWGMMSDGPAHQHHNRHRSRHSRIGNDYSEPRQIISLAEDVTECQENQQATCFSFSLDPKTRRYHVESTKLWLYVKPNTNKTGETLGLVERTSQGVKFVKKAEVQVSPYEGWVRIDIKRSLLRQWLTSGTQQTWVEVMCRTCGPEASVSIARQKHLKPFVVVTMQKDDSTSHLRGRRSLRPRNRHSQYNPCCNRRPFVVNFTEIELDFIIFPRLYDAGYCEGSCAVTGCLPQRPVDVTAYPREDLLRRYEGLNTRPVIPSCCAPSAKTKHSLVLHNPNNRIITEHIQDMIVTECECVF